MDKEKIKKYQIFSVFFTAIFGTLFHFTYDWSGKNLIVGIFSAVNESTWEHLKLLFIPMLLTVIIGAFYFNKKVPNFICAKTVGIITAMLFTVVFYYTYSGIIGKDVPFISILSFFVAIFIGEFVAYLLMINHFKCNKLFCIFVLIVLLILFIIFTFNPIKIGLFKDPLNNTYGINN